MNLILNFRPQSEKPTYNRECILFNQCDGFHLAWPAFAGDKFLGFSASFLAVEDFVSEAGYAAWAYLPDSADLYQSFADKPVDGLSAYEVTLRRLAAQRAAEGG